VQQQRGQLRGRAGQRRERDLQRAPVRAVANGAGNTAGQLTEADAFGNLSFAYAGGPNVGAEASTQPGAFGPGTPGGGTLNLAVAQGSNVTAVAGDSNANRTDVGNAAFNIANDSGVTPNFVFAGGDSTAGVVGVGNVAANLGGVSNASQFNVVDAFGQGNVATNVGGTGNITEAGDLALAAFPTETPPKLSTAFSVGGSNNIVVAAPGPFNVAGQINHTGTPATTTALNTVKFG